MHFSIKHLFYILVYLIFLGNLTPIFANNNSLKYNYLGATSYCNHELDVGEYQTNSIRKQINLSGVWKAAIDQSNDWIDVIVPGVFTFEGTVIYKRNFFIPPAYKNFKFKLVMLGINYRCSIFINEKFIGNHQGGFTSFSFNIDHSLIQPGQENSIRIIVSNLQDTRCTLPLNHNPMSLPNYGGIFREIFLQLVPEQSIENLNYEVKLSSDTNLCYIDLKFFLHHFHRAGSMRYDSLSDKNNYQIKFQIKSPEPQEVPVTTSNHPISFNQDVLEQFSFLIPIKNPLYWSPRSPSLYLMKIMLLAGEKLLDELDLTIGLVNNHQHQIKIVSNNQQIQLKGICWYENNQNTGFLVNNQAMERECKSIKELGANAVRIINQPAHPYFLKLCSEIGLYVLEEIPIRYLPATIANFSSYKELAEIYLEEMIQRDKIYPCVLGWGISNTVDPSDENLSDFLSSLKEIVRKKDSRFTYIVQPFSRFRANSVADIIFTEINNPAEFTFPEFKNLDQNEKIHIFSMECPLWTGDNINYSEIELESMQAYVLTQSTKRLLGQNSVGGVFIHCLKDFNVTNPCLSAGNAKESTLQPYGLVNSNFEKRLAYQYVAALFQANSYTPISRVQFEIKYPIFYTFGSLCIILFFLFFYKRQKKLRENLSRSFFHLHGLITDIREQRNIPVLSTLVLGGLIAGTLAIIISSHFYYYRNNFLVDQLLNLLIPWSQFKTYLIIAIWEPSLFTFCLIFLIITLFIIQAFLTKFFGYFFRQSISFIRALTFSVWIASNYIFLIPIALIYYRFLVSSQLSIELVGFVTLFHIWFLIRFAHGLSTLYFAKLYQIILTCGIFAAVILGSILLYYQRYYAFFDYLKFYLAF